MSVEACGPTKQMTLREGAKEASWRLLKKGGDFLFFFSCVWLLAAEQIDPSLSFYICKMREVSTVLCAAAGLSASNTAPGTGASPLESTVVS